MEKTYLEQLCTLTISAQQAITEIVLQKKCVILFSSDEDQDEEWTEDIYDMPDFPFYDKYNNVQYAAIKEIHLQGESIEIAGILKGDDYPKEIKIELIELDGYSSAVLADYLQSPITPAA